MGICKIFVYIYMIYVYIYIQTKERHVHLIHLLYNSIYINCSTSTQVAKIHSFHTSDLSHESRTSGLHWSGLHGKSGTINVRICWICTAQGVLSKESLFFFGGDSWKTYCALMLGNCGRFYSVLRVKLMEMNSNLFSRLIIWRDQVFWMLGFVSLFGWTFK